MPLYCRVVYMCLVLVHFNLGRKKFREQLFEHFKVQNSQHGGRPRDGGGGPEGGPGGRVHREPRSRARGRRDNFKCHT
jgi:hypothetical protein